MTLEQGRVEWFRLNQRAFARAEDGKPCPCGKDTPFEECCKDWWMKLAESAKGYDMPSDSHVNVCGHSYDELVWDHVAGKYVCGACIRERTGNSHMDKLLESGRMQETINLNAQMLPADQCVKVMDEVWPTEIAKRFVKKPDFACPYCGREYDIHRDDLTGTLVSYWGDDSVHEIDCYQCERTFLVEEHVIREFTVEKIDDKTDDQG